MSRHLPSAVACAMFLAACSPRVHGASSLAAAVAMRYGEADTRWITSPDHLTMALTLTDRRWTAVRPGMGLRDSARAIARFALGEIDRTPGLARPDSIVVMIQTVDRGVLVFRQTGSSGFGFASKEL